MLFDWSIILNLSHFTDWSSSLAQLFFPSFWPAGRCHQLWPLLLPYTVRAKRAPPPMSWEQGIQTWAFYISSFRSSKHAFIEESAWTIMWPLKPLAKVVTHIHHYLSSGEICPHLWLCSNINQEVCPEKLQWDILGPDLNRWNLLIFHRFPSPILWPPW